MSDQDPSSGDEEATMEELSDERENETTRKRKALSPPVKQEKKKFPKQDRETSDESMAEDSDREKSSDENSASDEPLTHIEMEVTERLMSQMSRQWVSCHFLDSISLDFIKILFQIRIWRHYISLEKGSSERAVCGTCYR